MSAYTVLGTTPVVGFNDIPTCAIVNANDGLHTPPGQGVFIPAGTFEFIITSVACGDMMTGHEFAGPISGYTFAEGTLLLPDSQDGEGGMGAVNTGYCSGICTFTGPGVVMWYIAAEFGGVSHTSIVVHQV